jgi:hypothetical protein
MSSLKDIISDIRNFLYGGVRTLPLTLAGTLIVLGFMTANYAILFFLIGFLILTPIASQLLNFIAEKTPLTNVHWFKVPTSDVCNVTIPYITNINKKSTFEFKFTSLWIAMFAFFSGYLATNAIELYKRPSVESSISVDSTTDSNISEKVTNRTSQALTALISICVFYLIIIITKYYSGCESIISLIITSLLFGMFGLGWYKALSSIGEDRLSDLFGIANRLIDLGKINNPPVACIPIPA